MTRNLQQPPWFGPYWMGRRIAREGRRWAPRRGRWITYAAASLAVLALVPRIVLASCRGLPVAGRGFPSALLSRLLTAVVAPIHMATITAAADRERPLALPAVPRMQNCHLRGIAHPVRLRRANPGQRLDPMSRCRCLVSAVRLSGARPHKRKAPASTGAFLFPRHPQLTAAHPTRYRADDAVSGTSRCKLLRVQMVADTCPASCTSTSASVTPRCNRAIVITTPPVAPLRSRPYRVALP